MGVKFAAIAAAVFVWGVSASIGSVVADETRLTTGMLSDETTLAGVWPQGPVDAPARFQLSPIFMAQAQTVGGATPDRTVAISGPVLYTGTALLLLAWFGWARSRA